MAAVPIPEEHRILPEFTNRYRKDIRKLQPHHRSMARAMIAGGKRPGELARMFGLTAGQVNNIIKSPLFERELGRLESLVEYEALDMASELEMRQPLALEAIDRGLLQEDAKAAAAVGFEILDRTGFPKGSDPQRHLHLHGHLHKEVKEMKTEELMDEIMDGLQEGGS